MTREEGLLVAGLLGSYEVLAASYHAYVQHWQGTGHTGDSWRACPAGACRTAAEQLEAVEKLLEAVE